MAEETNVDPIDAVFVIGTGSKMNNEELKYALRNLEKHCPFIRDVYISGECPDWVDTSVVKHLKWPDRFSHAKDANIIDKLRHACETEGISKHILFCSDDQFQTRVCTWDDFEPRWLRKYSPKDSWYEDRKRIWHSRLHQTLERDRQRREQEGRNTGNVFYYQPHMWMQIDRDKFIEYAKWSDYEKRDDTIIASGYFNYADVGGKANFDHIFISQGQKWPVKETHVAYTDSSFNAAMYYLKSEFREPSKYEKEYAKKVETRSDEEIIDDFKGRILKETVWNSLKPEVDEAERMRQSGASGWKKVWNDIIRRWASITDKGKLLLPIPSTKGVEAIEAVEAFRKGAPVADRSERAKAPAVEEEPDKKKCTKCEEKRRRMKERAAAKKEDANGMTKATDESDIDDDMACIDCAVEHLAVAAAYLNARISRPTNAEIELAKGEISVAAQHLLAAERHTEYNRCIEILDSYDTEKSILSMPEVRKLILTLIGD